MHIKNISSDKPQIVSNETIKPKGNNTGGGIIDHKFELSDISKSISSSFDFDQYLNVQDADISTEKLEHAVNHVITYRKQDIMDLIMAAFNIERCTANELAKMNAVMNFNELKAAAQEMRNSAKKMEIGAWVSFGLTAAASAISVCQSAAAMKSARAAAGASNKAGELKNTLSDVKAGKAEGDLGSIKSDLTNARAEAKFFNKNANTLNNIANSVQQLGGHSGKLVDTLYQSRARENEADMKVREANASLHQTGRDNAHKYVDNIKNLFASIIQTAKEMRDTQDQVKANIARNA